MISDSLILAVLLVGFSLLSLQKIYLSLSPIDAVMFITALASIGLLSVIIFWEYFSRHGKEKQKRIEQIKEIPESLLKPSTAAVFVGQDQVLDIPVYLPDSLRSRHVHILGATGSGKTESVILNFLEQDVARGLGSIILDAKGDISFLESLNRWVPQDKLRVFDLGSNSSMTYDPLAAGSPLESAQRLFSSLVWSEEYYKSKAFTALQRLFQIFYEKNDKNPTLLDLSEYLENPDTFAHVAENIGYSKKQSEKDFSELSGLRDQVRTLCTGYLAKTLSPSSTADISLGDASKGYVLYFRLQSLMSPQLVTTLGRLVINHLNYVAGSAHRIESEGEKPKLIPVYLDEFASFACPEFADLISKARSAGIALHFSHQSVGDLAEVAKGFLNRITDNSATKIVLRINDPDSADFFARSFGTKLYQKVTQRITNAKEAESAEVLDEGSQREAHQFRAPPDLLKTLPTGVGSVLIAHGYDTPHGASSVFKIKFPHLKKEV